MRTEIKKKITIITLLFIIIIAAVLFLQRNIFLQKKDSLFIATAGPMNRPEGKEMVNGIRLYIDQVNKKGGIDGRKVELLILNDKDEKGMAMKIATEVSYENRVLLMLGHYGSSVSSAVGEIYKNIGLPAITASATAKSVTFENEWFFRVVPDNVYIANVIINFIKNILEKDFATVIYVDDNYGSSLVRQFEDKAKEAGIGIKKKFSYRWDDKKLEEKIEKLVSELRAMDDPGVLFFATHAATGIKIITSIKYPGTNYSIIGPDSFSTPSFVKELGNYPRERTIPGYYSNGIYAMSPIIIDIADKKAYEFRKEYQKKYKTEPSWIAASYYDAAHVAVKAIERAEIQGNDSIRKNRRAVRNAIAGFDSFEAGIRGLGGLIFFDKNGDIERACKVGFYENQKFIPSFSQYEYVSQDKYDTFKQSMANKILMLEGKAITKTQIVHTGIDINKIEIDFMNSLSTIDFYLWFRFKGEFSDKNISFINSVHPVNLDHPIKETVSDKITTRVYHINAEFKNEFEFKSYPFGKQLIRLQIRHDTRTRNSLIFVPDFQGMQQSKNNLNIGNIELESGWKINDFYYYDIEKKDSDTDDYFTQIPFSRFDLAIRIERKNLWVIIENFFPFFAAVIILYLSYFVPADRIYARILIIMTVILINQSYQQVLFKSLGMEVITVTYCFYIICILSSICTGLSVVEFRLDKKEYKKRIWLVNRAGQFFHVLFFLISGFFFAFKYYSI